MDAPIEPLSWHAHSSYRRLSLTDDFLSLDKAGQLETPLTTVIVHASLNRKGRPIAKTWTVVDRTEIRISDKHGDLKDI